MRYHPRRSRSSRYVTGAQLSRAVAELNERIDGMATQAAVDALTTELAQVAVDLHTASATLQSEIDALAAANPTLDLSALQAAATPLDGQAQALAALVPTPPAPTA
jgi:paraquat-inducible protein B